MSIKITRNSTISVGRQEQGVALIAVLLILILILVIGAVALRRSATDLKVATADQMDSILLQSSESANQKLEAAVNGAVTSANYRNIVTSRSGVLGYFINEKADTMKDEFVYCFDTTENRYLRNSATIYRGSGVLEDNQGVCEQGGDYRYTSDRETVVTQVNVTRPDVVKEAKPDDRGFAYRITTDGVSAETHEFDIYATSIIPAYGNPTGCLANRTTNTTATLMDCLKNSGSPHKVIYQRANLIKDATLSTR